MDVSSPSEEGQLTPLRQSLRVKPSTYLTMRSRYILMATVGGRLTRKMEGLAGGWAPASCNLCDWWREDDDDGDEREGENMRKGLQISCVSFSLSLSRNLHIDKHDDENSPLFCVFVTYHLYLLQFLTKGLHNALLSLLHLYDSKLL